MTMPDRTYYERRVVEERERARTAATEVSRQAHGELAELYARRLIEAPLIG